MLTKTRNPLIHLAFRLFCPLFLSNLDKMDKSVDKKLGNPWYDWVYAKVCPKFVQSWTNEIYAEKGLTARFLRVFSWILSICPDFRNFSLNFFLKIFLTTFFEILDKTTLKHPSNPWYYWVLCEISSVDKIKRNWTNSQRLTPQTLGITGFLCKISPISQSFKIGQNVDKKTPKPLVWLGLRGFCPFWTDWTNSQTFRL